MAEANAPKSETPAQGPIERLIESPIFSGAITTIILLNAAILGALTYPLPDWLRIALHTTDMVIIGIFCVEIALKLWVYKFRFFKKGWNWFDLSVVLLALIPNAGAFTVLRALRVLRLFRLFSVVPEMRSVVEALAKAIPGMGAIMLVLGVIFYVSAVMGSMLFSGSHPQFFGDVGEAGFTLFQIMTLESWSMGVARPIRAEHPVIADIFFVTFIVLTSFAVLNLFIAVIVDSMQSKHFDAETERQNEAHDEREQLLEEFKAMRSEIAELKTLLAAQVNQGDGGSTTSENRADKSE
ncbi:ion transporter [Maricaulaceae bacterium NA33B04]|nr:ion transporter [Maricaulaceae bacterium NA33B04]